jgi:phosphoribosyl-ATP pyrophosphohydrolase/phosphoribosyl-AMP cyclohydrolase/histidinol dehydrogenase
VDIVREAISKSIIVHVAAALEFSNDYTTELHIKDAAAAVTCVQNVGSVFVGSFPGEVSHYLGFWVPFVALTIVDASHPCCALLYSCGDYASGTNHALPTNGYAHQYSGVDSLSFQKHTTSQELNADGLKALGPVVATLADCEGLPAHANAVRIRLDLVETGYW